MAATEIKLAAQVVLVGNDGEGRPVVGITARVTVDEARALGALLYRDVEIVVRPVEEGA